MKTGTVTDWTVYARVTKIFEAFHQLAGDINKVPRVFKVDATVVDAIHDGYPQNLVVQYHRGEVLVVEHDFGRVTFLKL